MGKQIIFGCIVLCIACTFFGAGWVLFHRGSVSAGYAVIPMLATVAFLALYRSRYLKNK